MLEDLLLKRESVRKYSDKKPKLEDIEKCVKAALLSPSAMNSQPWKYIITDEPEKKEKLANATFSKIIRQNKFSLQAPYIITVIDEKPKLHKKATSVLTGRSFSKIDIGISVHAFCLMAAEMDIGTCILGWFNEEKVKKILNVPKGKEVALLITAGYPERKGRREKKRKEYKEKVSYNKY